MVMQVMRERAKGWLGMGFALLISIMFAAWGLDQFFDAQRHEVIAQVNQHTIGRHDFEQAYERAARIRRPATELETKLLKRYVLDTLVQVLVLTDAAAKQGFFVSADQVKQQIFSHPEFHMEGVFSEERYREALRGAYLTDRDLKKEIHNVLLLEQFQAGVVGTAFAMPRELDELVSFVHQTRDARLATVPQSRFAEEVIVREEQARQYYDKNTDHFTKPEQVKVDYIELSVPFLAATQQVTAEEIKDYHASHRNDFVIPERIRASHILLALPEDADDEAEDKVLSTLKVIQDQLAAGEDFADLAKAYSDDPVSAKQGGDLDWFGRGQMIESFEQEAFALDLDAISQPVRSPYGYHLIQLTGRQAAHEKKLADVSEGIANLIKRQKAEAFIAEKAEAISESLYEHPDTLVSTAEDFDLTIKTSAFIEKGSQDKLFGQEAMQAALFSSALLEDGQNSEFIQLEPYHFVAMRVVAHEKETLRPFNRIKKDIMADLKKKQVLELTKGLAKDFVAQAKNGTPEAVARTLKLDLDAQEHVTRSASQLPPEVMQTLFDLPAPSKQEAHPGNVVVLASGDVVAVLVDAIHPGDWTELPQEAHEAYKKGLTQSYGEYDFALLRKQAYDDAKIEIKVAF